MILTLAKPGFALYFYTLKSTPMKTTASFAVLLISLSLSFISCRKDVVVERRLLEVLNMDNQSKMDLQYDANGRLLSTQHNSTDTLFYNS